MIFEEVCCNTPASMGSHIVGPGDTLGRQNPAGVPSAADYEQIVAILRRHPNKLSRSGRLASPFDAIRSSVAITAKGAASCGVTAVLSGSADDIICPDAAVP